MAGFCSQGGIGNPANINSRVRVPSADIEIKTHTHTHMFRPVCFFKNHVPVYNNGNSALVGRLATAHGVLVELHQVGIKSAPGFRCHFFTMEKSERLYIPPPFAGIESKNVWWRQRRLL